MGRRGWIARDDRVEERRRRILGAAEVVFARRGYHRARTREIAEEAGVAEGTIYNYFANKRELLLALTQRIITESMPSLLARGADLRSLLVAVLQDRLEMLARRRALIRAVAPEMVTDRELRDVYLRQAIVPFIREFLPLLPPTLHAEELRPFNPLVVLPAMAGGSVAAFFFNEWPLLLDGKVRSLAELAAELADLFLDGLEEGDPPAPSRSPPNPTGDRVGSAP